MNTDTPETDAMSMTDDPLDFVAMIEHARRLERERDWAVTSLHHQMAKYDALFDEAQKIRKQRDEARKLANDIDLCQGGVAPCELAVKIMEKLDEAQKLSSALHEDQTNLILERDKATNQSVKLCDLAERMLKEMEYVDWLSTAAVFRDELNKIKEENK